MDSHKVGIGCTWCSWKACEICSSLVQKKKLTSFWSQGILGIKRRSDMATVEAKIYIEQCWLELYRRLCGIGEQNFLYLVTCHVVEEQEKNVLLV
jgi:hypothetical protein